MAISNEQIEAMERATMAAVGAERVREVGGWLLGLTPGSIHRAKSAAPLRHDLAADEAELDELEAIYREAGLAPAFRLAEVEGLAAIAESLARRGYKTGMRTLVQASTATALFDGLGAVPADVSDRPGEDWLEVFAGPGFDPADGAQRLATLSRSPDAIYASVRQGGRTAALGVASLGFGWAGVHGMRTDHAYRGQGMAARVLAGLATGARARGYEQIFLQVEDSNAAAISLYRRAGFETLWTYRYWS